MTHPDQIGRVVGLVGDVLGSDVVAAYLHGSAVLGGLRPHSDIDVLVVSRRPTTFDEKRRLVDGLFGISGRPRPLELTIVVESEIRPWRYPPRMDFQYGEWLRDEFEAGRLEPAKATNPDLVTLITMVLLGNKPLLGPPPAQIFDPVPPDDYGRAIVDGDGLDIDLEGDLRNAFLTLARMWSTLATRVIRSKDDAADWALARLPARHRPPLARARAIYLGRESEHWDDVKPQVGPAVEYLVAEIQALTAGVRPTAR